MVHLNKRILHSRKKEGSPTFCGSMDGTGEYYAKWNKPVSERQILCDLTSERNLMNNKLTNEIEPQAWKHGTDWQWPEVRGEGDNGGKKGKELEKRTCTNDPQI